jgi:hypothetical protein
VPTILLTFFNHYADFDWQKQIVFDPFFHKRLRYVRTSREAMVILGFHSPSLNVATTASSPSVRTISEEFKQADQMLSGQGVSWAGFLGIGQAPFKNGPSAFLQGYKSYVKIDVQFWGVSHAKGSQYVGWLESRCVMLLVGKSTTSTKPIPGLVSTNILQKLAGDFRTYMHECGQHVLSSMNCQTTRKITKDAI